MAKIIHFPTFKRFCEEQGVCEFNRNNCKYYCKHKAYMNNISVLCTEKTCFMFNKLKDLK